MDKVAQKVEIIAVMILSAEIGDIKLKTVKMSEKNHQLTKTFTKSSRRLVKAEFKWPEA